METERRRHGKVGTLARQPLVHFVVLGALLGGLFQWWADDRPEEEPKTIRVSAAAVSRLDAQWRSRWNRPPTQAELDGLVKARIREDVLYREAVAMGLDRNEPVIRRLLGQKLEAIAKDLIELSLAPTDQDLEPYYEKHKERYRPDALITFTHVFVDPDAREESAVEDAERIVAELQALGQSSEGAERYGDPFMLQGYYPEKDRQRIGSLFGSGFADSVFDLVPGEWHGPVLSGYGLHAVFVHDRTEFPIPALDEIRERLQQDWVDASRRKITEEYFAELLAQYDVVVEGQPVGDSIDVASTPGT